MELTVPLHTPSAVSCPVKGQVFTACGSACPANCTTPSPICTRQCVRRCECPRGTVIDEISNSCVTLDECPSKCPPDKPLVNCFVDPCRFGKCPAHPTAVCRSDFCGGCNARFFDAKGNEVTDNCGTYASCMHAWLKLFFVKCRDFSAEGIQWFAFISMCKHH